MYDAQMLGASVAIVAAVLRHFRGASSVLAGAAPRRGESSRAVGTAMRAKTLCLRGLILDERASMRAHPLS
jgi:hypothetical protein